MIWWAIGAAIAGVLFSLNLALTFAGAAERAIYVVLASGAAALWYFATQTGAS